MESLAPGFQKHESSQSRQLMEFAGLRHSEPHLPSMSVAASSKPDIRSQAAAPTQNDGFSHAES
jgi:hypothetical protein